MRSHQLCASLHHVKERCPGRCRDSRAAVVSAAPPFWDCKGAGFLFNDQTPRRNIFGGKGVAVDSQRELFEKKLKSPRWGAEN